MIYVSEIEKTAPTEYKTDLQKKVYHALEDLQIPFERVGTDEVTANVLNGAIHSKTQMLFKSGH